MTERAAVNLNQAMKRLVLKNAKQSQPDSDWQVAMDMAWKYKRSKSGTLVNEYYLAIRNFKKRLKNV